MSRKKAPKEASGDKEWMWGGFVGGERDPCCEDGPEWPGRFGEQGDWDGDEETTLHYPECKGEEYAYLGHFRQQRYLNEGHNTTAGDFARSDYAEDMGGIKRDNELSGGGTPYANPDKFNQLQRDRKALKDSGGT